MKQFAAALAMLVLVLFAGGCKQAALDVLNLGGPKYVGGYMSDDDVRHLAHALDTAPARTPVKWENLDTGYQFSMMIFDSDEAAGITTRSVSVLAIEPSGDAEVIDLLCTSESARKWRIVAKAPAAFVGRAARMELEPAQAPAGVRTSDDAFRGFVVAQ
ncbi:hypothetical protein GKC30_02900 [Pseudodesulfovibrio sp. F-1]|uniref:Lipoprotein n=1 Tax=Pseudodesulfovibrio alkaliphilus TaxID=2661613 RepID=A0A7K1KKH9_9BACT|nr:hypothetical protein [Pseudodesulfovibrio alkaliphilus]MUM76579.1 hypothetical protein [Pseudodesulfovibrio alkaliphilus]